MLIERAERQIDLLRRVRPLDGSEQAARWLAARARGASTKMALSYAPTPDFGDLLCALERLSLELEGAGPLGGLYAGRARELALDAQLAENVGKAPFVTLARRRHAERPSEDWLTARRCASTWVRQEAGPPEAPLSRSDDPTSATSLLNVLRREVGRLRVPVRIQPCASLATRAATADGVIYIRSGVALGRRAAERIALHELYGHALPRVLSRAQVVGLFRVGSERAVDDEEGRAVLLEERAGLLDGERRRELGLRHVAALAVAGGADADECVRVLESCGCSARDGIEHYLRVSRGGGLCRELEYLPAWQRVSAALARDPDIDRWLARGRLGLHAAAILRHEGVALIEA